MRAMKVPILALFFAALAQAAAAAPLAGARLIDATGKISTSWVSPQGHGKNCRLAVDPGGVPWLGCRGLFLEAADYGALFPADTPFDDIAWLGAKLAAVSGDRFGIFDVSRAAAAKKAVAPVSFQTLASFPKRKVSIYPGSRGAAYLLVTDGAQSELVVLSPEIMQGAPLRLLQTRQQITAVAGDGRRTFIAFGRRVAAVANLPDAAGKSKLHLQLVYDDPSDEITALAYSPALGIFYATKRGVGFLGSRYHRDFLQLGDPQLQLTGGALYVLPREGGVLKLTGLGGYAALDAALAKKGVVPEFATDSALTPELLPERKSAPEQVSAPPKAKPAPEPSPVDPFANMTPAPKPGAAPPAVPGGTMGFKDD